MGKPGEGGVVQSDDRPLDLETDLLVFPPSIRLLTLKWSRRCLLFTYPYIGEFR